MRNRLDCSFWRGRITAAILSALLVGLTGQSMLAVQDKDPAEAQFMSYAAFQNKWRCDQAAMKSLLLNALDDEKAFEKYTFDWYPGLLEPRHFLRIGIGVTYNDRGYDGELLTLGAIPDQVATGSLGAGRDPDGISSAGAGRDAGGGGGASATTSSENSKPESPAPGTDPSEFLRKYGGDLADNLVKRLQDRVNTNRLGSVLKHVDSLAVLVPEPQKLAEVNTPNVGDIARSSEGPGRGGGGSEKGPTMVEGGIPMGLGSGGEISTGTAGPGNTGGETNDLSGGSGTAAAAKKLTLAPESVKEPYNSVIPGVVCLNEGKRETLFAAAKEKGLDLLFIIDIKVQESRSVHFSTTNLRLFNVNSANGADKAVVQTKAVRHDYTLDEKTDKDILETELTKVFEEFDKTFLASPLPGGLKPEHVEKRLENLMASMDSSNRLKIAVEVVAFCRKGLLDPAKATAALDKIFNGGGQLLLTGAPEDRLAFLNRILAESN